MNGENNKVTVVVVAVLASNCKLEHNVLLLQLLVAVLQVADAVNCLSQHSGLVQLTDTHRHTVTDGHWRDTQSVRHKATEHQLNKCQLHNRIVMK